MTVDDSDVAEPVSLAHVSTYRMTVHPPRHRWSKWVVTVDSAGLLENMYGAMFTAKGHTRDEAVMVAKSWCDADAFPPERLSDQVEYRPQPSDRPLEDYDG